jgi:hypothetical protein
VRAVGLVALTLLGFSISSCEAVLGIDFDAVEPQSACGSAQPNGPPPVEDARGTDELVVVTTNSRFGDGSDPNGKDGYFSVGYDLDHTCTGRGGKALCKPPPWAGSDVTDGPNGEDNGVGRMFRSQERVFGLDLVTSDSLNMGVVEGKHAPTGIVRVRGYNGFHDDDVVEVSWFVPLAPGAQGEDAFVPRFDGTDVWPLASDDLDAPGDMGEPMSLYRDRAAYVSNYQLVAHFPKVRIPITNIYFDINQAIVTADIVSRAIEGTKLEHGILAGVVSSSTFIEVLPLTTEAITGSSLCKDNSLYPSIKQFVCISADMQLEPGARECDGSSTAITFDTAAVTLGAEAPIVVPPSACTPENSPRGDTCADAAVPPPDSTAP